MKHGWGAVQVCTGVYRCAQVSTGVYRCVQVSTGVYRCVCDWMAALRLTCRWTRTAACCWESFPDSYWTGTCTGTCYTSTQHTNRETVRRTSSEQSPSEQNRTEQNSLTTMWPGFYMWFLSEWFLNLHCITDGNALLFRSEAAVVVFQLCTVVYIMMLLNSN